VTRLSPNERGQWQVLDVAHGLVLAQVDLLLSAHNTHTYRTQFLFIQLFSNHQKVQRILQLNFSLQLKHVVIV
jgi:hypothetical protein